MREDPIWLRLASETVPHWTVSMIEKNIGTALLLAFEEIKKRLRRKGHALEFLG